MFVLLSLALDRLGVGVLGFWQCCFVVSLLDVSSWVPRGLGQHLDLPRVQFFVGLCLLLLYWDLPDLSVKTPFELKEIRVCLFFIFVVNWWKTMHKEARVAKTGRIKKRTSGLKGLIAFHCCHQDDFGDLAGTQGFFT